jgi:GT2 family glycosyltransferase
VTSTATVIIVNYNGAHLLPACLDGLAAQRGDGPEFDTIVVDNASADGSRKLLARDYPWVTVLANADNLGFAGGNNAALDTVRTPYAVLLNNDAVPQPGWLRNLLAVFSQPGNTDIGIVTGKVLFMPKFAPVAFRSPGFRPGTSDSRELGVRILKVEVDGIDVTEKVLWEQAVYGPEGSGEGRFRWSRPQGEMLVPLPERPHTAVTSAFRTLGMTVAANGPTPFTLSSGGRERTEAVGPEPATIVFELDPQAATLDVVNNVGGQVFAEGSGGDRGFQEVDHGQYEQACEVFTACGNGMAMRTAIGHELGWFDDGFFMYYEDTDLSWRWRAAGWSIRYEPTAVLRHIHAASSKEWSPRWVFHVERNRLLMLTKNASAELARTAVSSYVRETAGGSARAGRQILLHRTRPEFGRLRLRLQVLRSYTAHLPAALRDRHRLRRAATVSERELQGWLVTK